jgi:hypothetical protein
MALAGNTHPHCLQVGAARFLGFPVPVSARWPPASALPLPARAAPFATGSVSAISTPPTRFRCGGAGPA